MNKGELLATFAQNIRTRRFLAGYTQKQLAEAAQIAVGSVSAYENGVKAPPVTAAYALAEALGTTLNEMFIPIVIKVGGEEE